MSVRFALQCGVVALLLIASPLATAEPTYPGVAWTRLAEPEKLGWSREKLAAAREYSKTIDTAAVMIVVGGQVLDEWGETDHRFFVHSIRKSLLSSLYGIHVAAGHIKLTATMADLGIDDNEPSLTAVEKQATVHDLLKARSGVYHNALSETQWMKDARPRRGSHPPGAFWYYNNWDFNVLGTIFERETKTNLFVEFKTRVADPIGMQDFRIEDCRYHVGPDSVYPAYRFKLTARDMARFGLLYLRQGKWRERQVIPSDWVKESTTSYSDAGKRGGYGYMWWVAAEGRHFPGVQLPDGSFSARGSGGHYILVAPAMDLVIVHRADTERPQTDADKAKHEVTGEQFGKLLGLILAAHEKP